MEESLLILRFNCPEQECPYMAHGWGDLRLHVRAIHGKFMWFVVCHLHISIFDYPGLIVICVYDSRKFSVMNTFCIRQEFYPFTCHLCTVGRIGQLPRQASKVVFTLFANFVGIVSLEMMNYTRI